MSEISLDCGIGRPSGLERSARVVLHRLTGLGSLGHAVATRLLDRLPAAFVPRRGNRSAPWHGTQIDLDLRDNLQRVLYFTGTYEPVLIDQMVSTLRRGDTVLDVGANIGLYTLAVGTRLRELGGGRIVAVEPGPSSRRQLECNIALAGIEEFVLVAAVAFSSRTGSALLRSNPAFGPADIGTASLSGSGIELGECELAIGADWLRDHEITRVDVIKLDVEGGEADAIAGLSALLQPGAPRYVQVELVVHHQERARSDRSAIFDAMAQLGLSGHWRSARGSLVADKDDHRSGNLVFARTH